MKHLLFLFLTLVCVSGWSINEEKKKDEKVPTKIELAGELSSNDIRSLILPLEAYENDALLTITTWQTMYDANVTISGIHGIIFSQSLTLMENDTETFDISGYANGIYTLTITTPQGTYLSGMFEIE